MFIIFGVVKTPLTPFRTMNSQRFLICKSCSNLSVIRTKRMVLSALSLESIKTLHNSSPSLLSPSKIEIEKTKCFKCIKSFIFFLFSLQFTIFGTLLRPRKLRKGVKKKTPKRGDDNQSSSKHKDVDVSKHSEVSLPL